MNQAQRPGHSSASKSSLHFDDCVEMYHHNPDFFRRHYYFAVLIGLGVVGDIDEKGERGDAQTFLADLHDASDPATSLRRRIWWIRKSDYGPETQWIRVGRSSDNDIVIPDYSISKQHCEFRRTSTGELAIYDLGSHNGTHVGGHEIPEQFEFAIRDEDELILGRYAFEFLGSETFMTRIQRSAAMI